MNYIKFTDWQELGLKKDVEQINKALQKKESTLLSFCWETFCFFSGFIITINIDDEENKLTTVLVCIIAAMIPLIVIIFHKLFNFCKRVHLAEKGILNVSDKIDIFDNKICCLTMMSTSYVDMLATHHNNISQSEQLFLFQEINYYINKSIDEIYSMQPIIKKVFSNDYNIVKKQKLISLARLYNIIEILEQSRPIVQFDNNKQKYFILLNQSNTNNIVQIGINFTAQTKEIFDFQINIDNEHKKNLSDFKKVVGTCFNNSTSLFQNRDTCK